MRARRSIATSLLLILTGLPLQADVIVTTGRNLSVDVSPLDGRIVTDLMGNIWTLPATGGQASPLIDGVFPLTRPRWSPDGERILYQAGTPEGTKLWIVDRAGTHASQLSESRFHDQDASWHPHGERIVFSSDRSGSGLDIWETDLPTGLTWRITDHPGDETEPVWSATGRHIAYIRELDGRYALVLRRHGEPEVDLVVSETPLSAPSWRPDGSLITFLRHNGDQRTLEMAILSEPVLVRPVATGEEFFAAPVTWRDRMHMLYAADGGIKTRGFNDRRSRPLNFRAIIESAPPRAPRTIARKELGVIDAPRERLVIRGARLFDGIWSRYREDLDVVIEAGRIAAIEPRSDRAEGTVLDLGDVTIIPGLIDAWSALPNSPSSGPALLAYGITTVVSDDAVPFDPALWESEAMPGPRLLAAASIGPGSDVSVESDYFLVRVTVDPATPGNARATADTWRALGVPVIADSLSAGSVIDADLLLGAGSIADSAVFDTQAFSDAGRFTLISGMADSGTPGMSSLVASRQAAELGHSSLPGRRFSAVPELVLQSASIVAGSKPNRLPPGLALHAELRALAAAGLSGEQVLHAAGRNAATVLGLSNQVGTITPGAVADLVLVAGDPLARTGDTLKIVAVVRNGRFFSLVSLLERAAAAEDVE